MFLSVQPYAIDDVQNRNLSVVCEATTRAECEDYIRAKRLAECQVLKESGEELYKGICVVETVTTEWDKGQVTYGR